MIGLKEKKTTSMIFFITFLRALAACVITNSHYTGIYPTVLIAIGGLIGDVLFFSVSGYCLYNVKYKLSPLGFASWYGKRLWRVFPPVLVITAVYMIAGAYSLEEHNFFWWYFFPTSYHFVASIIILYVPFFFVMKIGALKNHLIWIMAGVGVAYLAVYVFFYDKSTYHIDKVREPMIWFLFFESMLLGALFRQRDSDWRNKFNPIWPIAAFVSFCVYFASKTLFSKKTALAPFQILNQVAILVLLYFLFRTFCSIDGKLEKMPTWLKNVVSFISSMTLEIYVVQSVLIGQIRGLKLVFPLNWLAVTAAIIAAASLLHLVCELLYKGVDKLFSEFSKKVKK